MTILTDADAAIDDAIAKIKTQQFDPSTPAETMPALDSAIEDLLNKQHQIEMTELDQAAAAVEAAATALQAVIDDARLDTLAQLKQQLSEIQAKLDGHGAALFGATKMAKASVPAQTGSLPTVASTTSRGATAAIAGPAGGRGTAFPSAPPVVPGTSNPSAPPAVNPTPHDDLSINSTRFDDLKTEYEQFYATCVTVPGKQSIIQAQITKLLAGRSRYAGVAADTPGMPWYLVGIIHGMEAGYRFNCHQHNGDPLTARTVQVPVGRPPVGTPPFTWEESARDALLFDGLTGQTDFSIPRLLYFFEKYNGFGYRSHGVPSPYLWGFSTHYKGGKFIADHVFSQTAISNQVGAAVLLKTLEQQGGMG